MGGARSIKLPILFHSCLSFSSVSMFRSCDDQVFEGLCLEQQRPHSSYLIFGLFGLFFSAGTVFFSYNNSARTVFFSQFQSKFSKPNGAIDGACGAHGVHPNDRTPALPFQMPLCLPSLVRLLTTLLFLLAYLPLFQKPLFPL